MNQYHTIELWYFEHQYFEVIWSSQPLILQVFLPRCFYILIPESKITKFNSNLLDELLD